MNEAQALLLTGVPGIGKTTIVKRVAAALSGRRIRGFVTGEIRRAGRRVGFELSTFTGHKKVLAEIQVIPIGAGVSVRKEVQRAHICRSIAVADQDDCRLPIERTRCRSRQFSQTETPRATRATSTTKAIRNQSRPIFATRQRLRSILAMFSDS